MAEVKVVFIRVDSDRNILGRNAGFIKLNRGNYVNDIIWEVRKRNSNLAAISFETIEVYKLLSPVPQRRRRSIRGISEQAAKAVKDAEASFERLKEHIKEHGIGDDPDDPLLEYLPNSDPISVFETRSDDYITAIVYHPRIDADYPTNQTQGKMKITPIAEERTFKTARIDELRHLTRTAPCQTNELDLYDHVFMGHPHSHKAFHVALYDQNLAELTYKLKHLDDPKGEELFPYASELHAASEMFWREASGRYPNEKERSKIAFKWLDKIFGNKCVKQVSVAMTPAEGGPRATAKSTKAAGKSGKRSTGSDASEASESSQGSGRSIAVADGAVTSVAGIPPLGEAEKGVEGAVVAKTKQFQVLPVLFEIKNRFGDGIMQSVKVSARNQHALEETYVFDQTNFPTVIITFEGNLLRIAVSVNVGNTLVDKLVLFDIQGSDISSHDRLQIKRLERIASALREASVKLDTHVASLSEQAPPENAIRMRFPQPTLHPSETGIPIWKEMKSALKGFEPFSLLEFKRYLRRDGAGSLEWFDTDKTPREKVDLMRGLYVAEGIVQGKESVEVVVKFVQSYGVEAHELLAKEGSAPQLYGCRQVIGGWYMVVMDRVKGKQWNHLTKEDVNETTFEKLEKSIELLHKEGFVHGDLRICNVMVVNKVAKVIDFDWAIKGGAYPEDINMKLVKEKLEFHEEVKASGRMDKKHDLYALERLKKVLEFPASNSDPDAGPGPAPSSKASSPTISDAD